MVSFLRQVTALSKPRIVLLLVVTGAAGAWKAAEGSPDALVLLTVVVAGALAASGANAINQSLDADIDTMMRRTRVRPVPAQQMSAQGAAIIGVVLVVAATALMGFGANPLAAALTLAAAVVYVLVYTLLLKRRSWNNIVIGGAAGAVPVLVGWSAVTNELDWPPLVLFAIIFVWTPPHFWALAIRYREDYEAADVPMLPVVVSLKKTASRIVLYTLLLWGLTLVFAAVARMGWFYFCSAVLLGAVFAGLAVRVFRQPEPERAMRLFGWSITYVTLLFVAMAVDEVVRSGV